MTLLIHLNTDDVKRLVVAEIQRQLGDVPLNPAGVKIEVKTSQNYKAEWENGQFKVTYNTDLIPSK